MAGKSKGRPENLNPVQSKEEARARGRAGGIKSGEVRRNKKDAREAINLLLSLKAKGNLKANLEKLGVEDSDATNMLALQASLFTKAMSGDMNAYKMLMEYGGFNQDMNNREKESEARVEEIKARTKAIEEGPGDTLDVNERDDVVIYLPKEDDD